MKRPMQSNRWQLKYSAQLGATSRHFRRQAESSELIYETHEARLIIIVSAEQVRGGENHPRYSYAVVGVRFELRYMHNVLYFNRNGYKNNDQHDSKTNSLLRRGWRIVSILLKDAAGRPAFYKFQIGFRFRIIRNFCWRENHCVRTTIVTYAELLHSFCLAER